MIIGKIDYINLLPFYVFLKKELNSQEKSALNFHKGVPSKINNHFKKHKVEAAVVSSIVSAKYSCSDLGIIANKKVLSVLVCEGKSQDDKDSNTSNILAKVLDVKGSVFIGDKALLKKDKNCKDLAALWYKKYKLPFVFARFCFNKKEKKYKKLSKKFLNSHIKIPQYILKKYSKERGIEPKEIKAYLKLISYRINHKSKISLKKFIKLTKNL